MPTWALPSIAQAVAVRIGGMKKGRVISTSSTPRPGVSVRATIQASRMASASGEHGLDQRDADGVGQHHQVLGRGDADVAVEVEVPAMPGGVECRLP